MSFGVNMPAQYKIVVGETIATENFNIPRNEFVALSWEIAKKDNEVHRAAIEHYDLIQEELREYEYVIKN
jgi:hypothetical protein